MIENFQDADVDFEENDFSLQYIRGIALYELGDYEEALAPLNALLAEEQVTEMLEDLFPGGNAESRFQEALNKCLEEEEFDSFNGLGTIRSSHSDWDLDLGFTPPSESFDDYTPWTNEDSSED